jgi:hypothetical protein
MSEICGICEIKTDEVIDGICEKCEPLWLDGISKISTESSGNTPLKYLFEQAIIEAKKKYNLSHPKSHNNINQ